MTAIAWKLGMLAADSLASTGGMKLFPAQEKVRCFQLLSGVGLVTGAGKLLTVERYWRWAAKCLEAWVSGGCDLETLPAIREEEDATVLIALPGGALFNVSRHGAEKWDGPICSAGEPEFLVGAMLAGASPERAVGIACETSIHCGWPVRLYDCETGLLARFNDLQQLQRWSESA